jgi:hypothetical protein
MLYAGGSGHVNDIRKPLATSNSPNPTIGIARLLIVFFCFTAYSTYIASKEALEPSASNIIANESTNTADIKSPKIHALGTINNLSLLHSAAHKNAEI